MLSLILSPITICQRSHPYNLNTTYQNYIAEIADYAIILNKKIEDKDQDDSLINLQQQFLKEPQKFYEIVNFQGQFRDQAILQHFNDPQYLTKIAKATIPELGFFSSFLNTRYRNPKAENYPEIDFLKALEPEIFSEIDKDSSLRKGLLGQVANLIKESIQNLEKLLE